MTDFKALAEKVFSCHERIRSVTFSRLDGGLLHSEMRPGVQSLNPVGEIEEKESEILVPTLAEYFESYKNYLGDVDYMGAKFKRVSMVYIKHSNVFVIVSVEPGINLTPIVECVKSLLRSEFNGHS